MVGTSGSFRIHLSHVRPIHAVTIAHLPLSQSVVNGTTTPRHFRVSCICNDGPIPTVEDTQKEQPAYIYNEDPDMSPPQGMDEEVPRYPPPVRCNAPSDLEPEIVSGFNPTRQYVEPIIEGDYNLFGEPFQTFKAAESDGMICDSVQVDIDSNWGSPDYTCLYRILVHPVQNK